MITIRNTDRHVSHGLAIICGPLPRYSSPVDGKVKGSSKVDQSRPKSAMGGLTSTRTAFSSQLPAADDPDFTWRQTAAKLFEAYASISRLKQIRWKSAGYNSNRTDLARLLRCSVATFVPKMCKFFFKKRGECSADRWLKDERNAANKQCN